MVRHIFITGVSSGLGWGLARSFLVAGESVYGCSRREVADLSADFPDRFHHETLDLSEPDTAKDKLDNLLQGVGTLDLAILNAAILGEIRDLRETPVEELQRLMEVNVYANKRLIDQLAARPGGVKQVVAISSGASVSGMRGWNGYSLSKAALNMLVRLYAAELPDIHFTSLAPGLIASAMQDYLLGLAKDDRYEALEKLHQAKASGDMPDPEEAGQQVAAIVPKLLSHPSGSYLDIRKLQ